MEAAVALGDEALTTAFLSWLGLWRRASAPELQRATDECFVASVSPIEIPAEVPDRRTPPRPPEHRGARYAEEFDSTFLFYDVFRDGDDLVLIGPSLRNLAPLVRAARLSLDGKALSKPLAIRELLQLDLASLPMAGNGAELTFDAGSFIARVPVQPSHGGVFRNRKVLCTLSKDNDLRWISDWVEFHVKAHGADAVLIYDNASTRYRPDELLASIRGVAGIEAAVVVPWPFRYGPGGTADGAYWDSHYAQPVMLEHARRRFLRDAAAMVNADVDELVVAEDGVSLFEHLKAARSGAITYRGRWIENIRTGGLSRIRHRYYRHFAIDEKPYLPKWTAIPARIPELAQMRTHDLTGFEPDEAPRILFRHFRAVALNWKYDRTGKRRHARSRHRIDEVWVRQMEAIGWSKPGAPRKS